MRPTVEGAQGYYYEASPTRLICRYRRKKGPLTPDIIYIIPMPGTYRVRPDRPPMTTFSFGGTDRGKAQDGPELPCR